ncbi:MAG: NAD(P)H-binding protein [Chloroflexi bacterium]|nr:NAD(P)H-binding protein [Chloroflexota bacterium]
MKPKVALFGASGTMGYQALQELWRRRERYDIVLLVRPSARNRRLLAPYARQAGLGVSSASGIAQGDGLKIVWGDATRYHDVQATVQGVDWVLNAMAFISPQADYYPDMAQAVNAEAVAHIVQAIEAQPGGAERIRLVHTGTVAATGDRLGPIRWGRVGDPLKPSIFDYYAVTKIAGERAVLESNIRRWVSLRMTYIMPTTYRDFVALTDPIMFHQPLASLMENITDRDAGFGLVNALEVPDDSRFWRRVYNMGGGPSMRCTAWEFMDRTYRLMGLSGLAACSERRWFALRNFHMQGFRDSHILQGYLHHWRDSMDDFWATLQADLPLGMRTIATLSRRIPPMQRMVERIAYARMRRMAESHRNGTAYWYQQDNQARLSAFYGSRSAYESIPDWGEALPSTDVEPDGCSLNHGYDEAKPSLDLDDLQGAASFRGGRCLATQWDGDMYATLPWRCAFGHTFTAKPATVLRAGHWCPECLAPPWNYDREARHNPFFAQVWYTNHTPDEDNVYPAEVCRDIAGADRDQRSGR